MHKIGSWSFDPETATLRQGGLEIAIEDRSSRVLGVLCRRRGEIVSKGELLDEVWKGRTVSSNSVAIVIGDLRRALGESPCEPTHIVTVGKRGYRLAPPAELADPAPADPDPKRARVRHRGLYPACATAVAIIGALAIYFDRAREIAPVDLLVEPTVNETGQSRYDDLARSLTTVVMDRAVRFQDVRVIAADGTSRPRANQISLSSRLIMWNGAPELAMTAADAPRHIVFWSAFASGDSGNLARDAAVKLNALQDRLGKAQPKP